MGLTRYPVSQFHFNVFVFVRYFHIRVNCSNLEPKDLREGMKRVSLCTILSLFSKTMNHW